MSPSKKKYITVNNLVQIEREVRESLPSGVALAALQGVGDENKGFKDLLPLQVSLIILFSNFVCEPYSSSLYAIICSIKDLCCCSMWECEECREIDGVAEREWLKEWKLSVSLVKWVILIFSGMCISDCEWCSMIEEDEEYIRMMM